MKLLQISELKMTIPRWESTKLIQKFIFATGLLALEVV